MIDILLTKLVKFDNNLQECIKNNKYIEAQKWYNCKKWLENRLWYYYDVESYSLDENFYTYNDDDVYYNFKVIKKYLK